MAPLHHFLCQTDRYRAVVKDFSGGFEHPWHQFFVGYYTVHQAPGFGIFGIDLTPCDHQFHRVGTSNQAGQALCGPETWGDSQGDFRLAKFRLVRGDDPVTTHGQFAAAT